MKFNEEEKKVFYDSIQKLTKTGGWDLNLETMVSNWTEETYRIHELDFDVPTNAEEGINFYVEEDRPRIAKYVEDCMTKGIPFNDVFQIITAKGNKKWVRSIGSPVEDEDGNIIKLVGTFQDITEQVLKEQKLQESENYLKLAMEGTGLGIWDWYFADDSVKFDENWAKMIGYELNEIEMSLETWKSKVHPDDIDKCYEDIQDYLEGKTDRYVNIHRMKHKEGHWVWILDQGKISDWDSQGNPIRFTGTHFDVSSERNQKNRLEMFYQKSGLGYAFCDMQGNILDVNDEYCRITGYNLEELKKLSYWDLTPKKYEKQEAEKLNSLNYAGKYGPYSKEYINKSGSLINVKLNGFVVKDEVYGEGICDWKLLDVDFFHVVSSVRDAESNQQQQKNQQPFLEVPFRVGHVLTLI